ncbi:MAG: ThuA domain-containing protein [Acidobacteria bacterium]|nr:ThuA domain-containing protein [Acidobacteriota bacterium]
MRRVHARVVLAAAVGLSWWGVGGGGAAQGATPRILYLTQSAAFAHQVLDHSEQVLRQMAADSSAFEVTVSRDASTLTPARLADVAAVVFYTTGELPMDASQKAALLAFVRGGGGFVGVHSASDTFYEWPEYGTLVGGYFNGHPWTQEVTIRVENRTHPATAHLGRSFRIDDEIYQFRNWSRSQVDVLLSLDLASVDPTADGIRRDDGDFALAWTRTEGAGRVFYTALGHRPEVWDDPRFQRHLLGGIRWAMGSDAR